MVSDAVYKWLNNKRNRLTLYSETSKTEPFIFYSYFNFPVEGVKSKSANIEICDVSP